MLTLLDGDRPSSRAQSDSIQQVGNEIQKGAMKEALVSWKTH